ncbi:MAG: glycosyltransferase family 39 protein [Myxococcota bacterium]|nr:glycosyltransferase family 39 protein [Myxococcota bacterium]
MPGPRPLARFWPIAPVALIALLLALRALLHTPATDALATAPTDPRDPPATTAYAGSLYIARGGPVIIGVQSPHAEARITVGGRELRGRGLFKERLILPHGPIAIRVALPDGARLVWSPVGRRGDPEYVVASSLSPDPPETATFQNPGTAALDGIIAIALLLTIVGACLYATRRRLAAVPRDMWLAIAAIFVAGVIIRWLDLDGAGQTWDEDVNWAAGRNYVSNVLALDFRSTSWVWNYEHPPVMKYLAGVGAQLADGFGPARAISAILVALGCALLVPIGARLYNLRTGILAAVIATLLPSLIGHGKIVGHEAPTILWWSLAILLALGIHDGEPRTRALALRLAALGAVIGIAVASRFVNGLLGPLCVLIVVVQAPDRQRTLLWCAVMPVAAVLTIYAIWPRLWLHPIEALQASLKKLDVVHAPEPFLGAITSRPGPHYFLVYLYATLPVGILALAIAWLSRAVRDRNRATLLLLAWLAFPLLAALSPVRQDGVRYIMPAFPAIAMMAAAIVDRYARTPRIFAGAAAALALYLGITAVHTHPYYIDYFGEHTGGAGRVSRYKRFETAWWGEGLAPSLAYVNEHAEPNARVSRHCVEPSHLAWFREDLWANLPSSPADANWIVVYAPARMACPVPPDAKRVFSVEHDGTTLSAVYRR